MKNKIILCLMAAFLTFNMLPTAAKASVVTTKIAAVKPIHSEEGNALIARLEVLKDMDMSQLSSPEKQALRQEVRGIKNRLNALNEGIYISAGAIIIILLLILLLR